MAGRRLNPASASFLASDGQMGGFVFCAGEDWPLSFTDQTERCYGQNSIWLDRPSQPSGGDFRHHLHQNLDKYPDEAADWLHAAAYNLRFAYKLKGKIKIE